MKRFFLLIYIMLFFFLSFRLSYSETSGFMFVKDRFLYTPCGDVVKLRGVNKMVIWTNDLQLRKESYAEIKKTGANSVRIVWLAQPTNEEDSGPEGLDRNIQDAINNGLIPIVELHDATGDFTKMKLITDYWTKPEVLQVIKKHEKYLIINIANEAGDDQVTSSLFKTVYTDVIIKLRNAGIRVPFIIDAPDWGKNLNVLLETGNFLTEQDPLHNILYSVHLYWAISDGADGIYITQQLQKAVDSGLPLIIGEFTYKFNQGKACDYETDYKTIIKDANSMNLGWLAWEWGPGNEYYDASCEVMNMTKDSYYNNLQQGWATEVAKTSEYSIANTSVTPKYILNKGICDEVNPVADNKLDDKRRELTSSGDEITLYLNKSGNISLKLYNVIGENVSTLTEGFAEAGYHTYNVNALPSLTSGVYYCNLLTGTEQSSIKIMFLK